MDALDARTITKTRYVHIKYQTFQVSRLDVYLFPSLQKRLRWGAVSIKWLFLEHGPKPWRSSTRLMFLQMLGWSFPSSMFFFCDPKKNPPNFWLLCASISSFFGVYESWFLEYFFGAGLVLKIERYWKYLDAAQILEYYHRPVMPVRPTNCYTFIVLVAIHGDASFPSDASSSHLGFLQTNLHLWHPGWGNIPSYSILHLHFSLPGFKIHNMNNYI